MSCNVFSIIELARKKNKLKRELEDNERKVRDNRKRVELLANLADYLTPGMNYAEVMTIIKNMQNDYEDRVDDYIIKGADISKKRRDISLEIKKISTDEKDNIQ